MITYVAEYVEGWWGGGYELFEGNVAETEVGQPLYVSAEVYPSKAEQAYSYALKEATENEMLETEILEVGDGLAITRVNK